MTSGDEGALVGGHEDALPPATPPTDLPVHGDPTPDQLREVRATAATLLVLIVLLGVAAVLFATVEAQVFTAAMALIGGLAASAMLRRPERFVRGPDLDAFAREVVDAGGLPAHPGEGDASLRVRVLEGMELAEERVADVRERREAAWILGLSALIVPIGFLIPFLRLWNLGLLGIIALYLVAQRIDRVPKRRRAAEALALLEEQLAQLGDGGPESPVEDRGELTSGA